MTDPISAATEAIITPQIRKFRESTAKIESLITNFGGQFPRERK